ncbi:MFS transporter [Streptomyces sulphureus]|uniref:MFS transporter n=1 Tax=Streptomyces sulphureus TaxID=47758 RepID=UPI00037CD35E|nr:MFS transporter [Streptomyces sulphureus]
MSGTTQSGAAGSPPEPPPASAASDEPAGTTPRPHRPTRRSLRWSWQIFAVTWLAYAGYYVVRQAFSVAKLGILDDPSVNGVLTEHALGVIDAVYLAAYAVGQFLWGTWADRFGPRVVVIGGMIGAVAAAVLLGVSSAVLVFGGAMVLMGLAQSTGWAALCKNVVAFFPLHERGRVLGLWCSSYAFGGLVAPPFLGWCAYSLFDDWRVAFFASAATLSVVLLLFVVFQRNRPEDVGLPPLAGESEPADAHTDGEQAPRPSTLTLYREALRDRMVLTLGLAYFLLKPARYALLLWGPVLVSRQLPDASHLEATLIPVAFGIAGLLAPPAVGWLSDRVFGARRMPPCVLALGVLVVMLALFSPLTATGSVPVMVAVLTVIGFAAYAADALIAGVAAVDFGSSSGAGTVTGLVNGCGSIGAILGGLLPGFLSGEALFHGFAAAALVACLVMLPHWNRMPRSE